MVFTLEKLFSVEISLSLKTSVPSNSMVDPEPKSYVQFTPTWCPEDTSSRSDCLLMAFQPMSEVEGAAVVEVALEAITKGATLIADSVVEVEKKVLVLVPALNEVELDVLLLLPPPLQV